eukprot:COSAG01_NODE_36_length_34092_cov_26.350032_27_plen_124_part_00
MFPSAAERGDCSWTWPYYYLSRAARGDTRGHDPAVRLVGPGRVCQARRRSLLVAEALASTGDEIVTTESQQLSPEADEQRRRSRDAFLSGVAAAAAAIPSGPDSAATQPAGAIFTSDLARRVA